MKKSSNYLQEAVFLDLLHRPHGQGCDLVAEAVKMILAYEHRTRARGEVEGRKLSDAVAAVLGGVLCAFFLRGGAAVFRPLSSESFSGVVGRRGINLVLRWATDLGLLAYCPGIRYQREIDGYGEISGGRAARYAAAEPLLRMAVRHGITAANVAAGFPRQFPRNADPVTAPIRIAALEIRPGGQSRRAAAKLPVPKNAEAKAIATEVRLANAVFARSVWEGCQPPAMFRTYRSNFGLGGRWIVAGAGSVQILPPADRLRVRVDGQPVVEIDARASQLTLLAAASGAKDIGDDPYRLSKHDRATIKAAVLATLGLGRLPRRWSPRMLEGRPWLAEVDIAPVTADLAARYPFLTAPGEVLGVERRHVALRLMAIEAEVLTRAMVPLWREGLPVVPIHDGLLLPAQHRDIARDALVEAYAAHGGGAIIRVK